MYNKLSDAIKTANQKSFLRKTVVLTSSAATLALMGLTSQVYAQAASGDVEEVVITGIRGSLQKSLDVKRNSDAIVDAISAEDVGKFPDKNVAESLQRIPGVTIQRGFGEGAAVSIRGAGQDLTLTTLNGQNVASTGWFVLEPARRSFNYELLPSELVGNLEVFKSSQADLAEGGVGGTVVVHTRKPLDLDSMTLFASVAADSQSDSGEVDPQISAMGSWKNSDGNFGALVSLVSQKRHLQRQGNEAFWEWGAGPVAFIQDRERTAETLTLQFRPTDSWDIVFNAMNMEMAADNTNVALWLTQANTSWSGMPVADSDKLNGTTARGPLNVAYYQARPREATMVSKVYDATATYTGEGYEAKVQLGSTRSTGGTDFEMALNDGTGGTAIPGGTYDFFHGKQTWNTNGFNISTYNPGSLIMDPQPNFNSTPKTDGEDYIQGDIKFELDKGVFKSIKTGLKYADHDTTSRRFNFEQKAGFSLTHSTAGLEKGTIDVGAGDYKIMNFDWDAFKDWAKSSISRKVEDLGAYSEVQEKNAAAYVMGTFEQEALKGNVGVRYVTTDATSVYHYKAAVEKTEADGSYSEFLPSANLIFNLDDDLVMRMSAARVMARPQYVDMYQNPSPIGAQDEQDNNQYWVSGNINLKPFIANQFDVGIEWYFAPNSVASATLFTKDVKNFVNIQESHAAAADIPQPLKPSEQPFGWTVQQKSNGKAATINGLELQYQQDYGNGFGALVNYTYTDTTTDKDTFTDGNPILTDSSKNSYNVTGYYENDLFQVRLAYNFRSAYMLRESGAYGNRLNDDFGTLDMSASWNVTNYLTIKFDANNLTGESFHQYGNNKVPSAGTGFSQDFPVYEYEMARRYTIGASVKF